jgi:hypothetical protein
VEGGLLDALVRRPQPERPEQRNRDGDLEAHLVTLACRQQKEGTHAGRCVCEPTRWGNGVCRSDQSHYRVDDTKKNERKPRVKKPCCIPPEATADCVYHMEDV